MNLVAMMSFYDEPEERLQNCVFDLSDLGVTTIVAVDGAYSNLPGGKARSPFNQVDALLTAVEVVDLNVVLYQPSTTWEGDEVAKRQFMLNLAWSVVGVVDYRRGPHSPWFVVWDCDYELEDTGPQAARVRAALADTSLDVAEVAFSESSNDDGWHPMRMFMRAGAIKMAGNHHTYELPNGRLSQILSRPVPNMAEALDMRAVRVRHRVHDRDPERRRRQAEYYERRVETP